MNQYVKVLCLILHGFLRTIIDPAPKYKRRLAYTLGIEVTKCHILDPQPTTLRILTTRTRETC